jgi:hypothetical protein
MRALLAIGCNAGDVNGGRDAHTVAQTFRSVWKDGPNEVFEIVPRMSDVLILQGHFV